MFIKYTSIENTYNEKYLKGRLIRYPELIKRMYIMQHKYDGSNFQIIFKKNEPVKYASRNKLLVEGEKFFGYKTFLPNIKGVEETVQKFLENSEFEEVNLYGELYGSKVNGRIKYESEAGLNIKFFDVYFDRVVKSPEFFYEWTKKLEIPEKFIVETMTPNPVSLDDCLKFDTSSVKTNCDDIIEGVVIKLFAFIPMSGKSENSDTEDTDFFRLVLKLKNKAYLERESNHIAKDHKIKPVSDLVKINIEDGMKPIEIEFNKYVNQNRVTNAFGKQEWTKKDIKKLVDFVIADAAEDFLKDNTMGLNDDIKVADLKKAYDLPHKKTVAQCFIMAKKCFD